MIPLQGMCKIINSNKIVNTQVVNYLLNDLILGMCDIKIL